MGKGRIKVAIIMGGQSAEHEVSLLSAKNVLNALDKNKYESVLIGINKTGQWYLQDKSKFLLSSTNRQEASLTESRKEIANTLTGSAKFDVIFPVLHGPFGEDGTVQGLLKLANIPFVGAGVLGSAIGMDKDVQKRLLQGAKIPTAKFVSISNSNIRLQEVEEIFKLPFFVKPANLGSSVGVTKVHNRREFRPAVELAFKYDRKIIIEESILGREIECSVLGNEDPIASAPGEVVPKHEFYDYEAKYLDENGAVLEIPAKLSKDAINRVRSLAVKAFKVLCCEGMARVDMFIKPNGQILINEINTIPGFTNISMYPKLWEEIGISNRDLVDTLIQLARDRFQKEQALKTTR